MVLKTRGNLSNTPNKVRYVRTYTDFDDVLRSDILYILDGKIDMFDRSLEVPASGLYLGGHNFDVSGVFSSEENYTLFTSPPSGSGNLVCNDFTVSVTGNGSKVFDLFSATGNEALEFTALNFIECSSRGIIHNYRQGLETGVGFFGGSPELTMSGIWNGHRVDTTIVRGLSNGTTLFKAGDNFTLSGRFVTDLNCDLPATGSLLDFSEDNIVNDESLVIQGAFITRNGVVNPKDTTLISNITEGSVKSSWKNNTGLGNTTKYIKGVCSVELETPIVQTDTYYPLNGTITIAKQTHFDSPSSGVYRLLTGTGDYLVTGDLIITGSANDQIDIRIVKSTDNFTTSEEINHSRRVINNLSGNRDVAFFPINFIANLDKGNVIRVEIENKTSTNNVSQEVDSFLILSGI